MAFNINAKSLVSFKWNNIELSGLFIMAALGV